MSAALRPGLRRRALLRGSAPALHLLELFELARTRKRLLLLEEKVVIGLDVSTRRLTPWVPAAVVIAQRSAYARHLVATRTQHQEPHNHECSSHSVSFRSRDTRRDRLRHVAGVQHQTYPVKWCRPQTRSLLARGQ